MIQVPATASSAYRRVFRSLAYQALTGSSRSGPGEFDASVIWLAHADEFIE